MSNVCKVNRILVGGEQKENHSGCSKAAIKDQRAKWKASGSNLHKKDQNPLKKSILGLKVGEEK